MIIVKTKELFKAMSSDIKRTDFIKMVDDFRTQYKNNEDLEVVKIRLGDIMDFIAFDGDSLKNSAEVDFYVKRDNKIKDQIRFLIVICIVYQHITYPYIKNSSTNSNLVDYAI